MVAGKIEKIAPKFIVNVGKSVTYSMNEALKTRLMPNTINIVQNNSDGIRAITDNVKNYKSLGKKIKAFYENDKTLNDIREISRNATSDLITGKWYNNDRLTARSSKLSGLDNDWSIDFGEVTSTVGKATVAATNANTKAVIASSKAVADTISASSKISNELTIGTHKATMGALDVMNKNIGLVSTFNNELMKPFIEKTNKYFTDTIKTQTEIKDILFKGFEIQSKYYSNRMNMEEKKPDKGYKIDDVLSGGFNSSEYKKVIGKNIKGMMDNLGLGMLQGSGIDLMEQLKANPIATLMENVVNTTLIPKAVQESMKTFDDTIKGFLASGILKINDIAKNGFEFKKKNPITDFLSNISSQVASIFKVDIKAKNNVSLSEYEKGAIAFDGVTKKAIVDVIPMYLRKILSSITGSKEIVFDYDEGIAKTKEEVLDSYKESKKRTGIDLYGFKDKMKEKVKIKDKDERKNYEKDLEHFLTSTEGRILPIYGKDFEKFKKTLLDLNIKFKGENSEQHIFDSLTKMDESDILNYATETIDSRNRRSNQIKELEKNQQLLGLSQSLLDRGIKDSDKISSNSLKAEINGRKTILDSILTLMKDTGVKVVMKEKSLEDSKKTESSSLLLDANGNPLSVEKTSDKVTKDITKKEDKKKEEEKKDDEKDKVKDKEKTKEKKKEKDSIFKKINKGVSDFFNRPVTWFQGIINSATHKMYTIIYGSKDGEEAKRKGTSFFGKLRETMSNVYGKLTEKLFGKKDEYGEKIQEGLIDKAKVKLFGKKDDDGNVIQRGILSNVTDIASDSYKSVRRVAIGKGYTDSKGVKVEGINDSVLDIAKDQISSITNTVSNILLGGKDAEGNRNFQDGFINTMYQSVLLPFKTFKESFFGDSDGEVNVKSLDSKAWNEIKAASPEIAKGGMIGGVAGLLLPGGPILGALLGSGIQMVRKTETFNKLLLGERDENGNVKDGTGIIPKKYQDWFKANGTKMKNGIIAGGMLGMFAPGGPIVGSLIGSAISASGVADKLKLTIMGTKNEETGEYTGGLLDKLSPEQKAMTKKIGSSMAAGGLIGMLAPGGPLVGALALTGANMLVTSEKFKSTLFGEKDETGKRQGGIAGTIKDFFSTSIATPMKLFFQETSAKTSYWMNKAILNPVKDALAPFKKEGQLMFQNFKNMGSNFLKTIDNSFSKYIGTPLSEAIQTKLIDPVAKTFKSLFGGIGKMIMGVVSSPFKMLQSTSDSLMRKHIEMGEADYLEERLKNRRDRNKKQDEDYNKKINDIRNKKRENDKKKSSFFNDEREKAKKKKEEYDKNHKQEKKSLFDRFTEKVKGKTTKIGNNIRTKKAFSFNDLESDKDIERLVNANNKNSVSLGKGDVDQTYNKPKNTATEKVTNDNKGNEKRGNNVINFPKGGKRKNTKKDDKESVIDNVINFPKGGRRKNTKKDDKDSITSDLSKPTPNKENDNDIPSNGEDNKESVVDNVVNFPKGGKRKNTKKDDKESVVDNVSKPTPNIDDEVAITLLDEKDIPEKERRKNLKKEYLKANPYNNDTRPDISERLTKYKENKNHPSIPETDKPTDSIIPKKKKKQTDIDFGKTFKEIDKNTEKILDEVKGQLNGVGDNLDKILNVLEKKFKTKGESYEDQQKRRGNKARKGLLGKTLDFVTKPFKKITDGIINFKDNLVDTFINKPKEMIINTFTSIKTGITNVIGGIFKSVKGIFSGAWKAVKSTGTMFLGGLKGLGKATLGVASSLGSMALGFGKAVGSVTASLGKGVAKITLGLAEGMKQALGGVGEFVGGIFSAIGSLTKGFGAAIGGMVKHTIPALAKAIGGLTGFIFDSLSTLMSLGIGAVKSVGRFITSPFRKRDKGEISSVYVNGGTLDLVCDFCPDNVLVGKVDTIIDLISSKKDKKKGKTKNLSSGSTEAQKLESKEREDDAKEEQSIGLLQKISDSTSGLFSTLFSKKKGLWGILAVAGSWIAKKLLSAKNWLTSTFPIISTLGKIINPLNTLMEKFGLGNDGNEPPNKTSNTGENTNTNSGNNPDGEGKTNTNNEKTPTEKATDEYKSRSERKKISKEKTSGIKGFRNRRKARKEIERDLKQNNKRIKRKETDASIEKIKANGPSGQSVAKGATSLAGGMVFGLAGDSVGRNIGENINESLNINQNGLVGRTITSITGAAGQYSATKVGNKALGKLLDSDLGKAYTDFLVKIFNNPKVTKIIGKDAVEAISKKVLPDIARKAVAKAAVKISAWIASGSALLIAQVCADIVLGMGRTRKYFKVPKGEKPDLKMDISAGIAEALNGLSFGIVSPYWIASIVYKSIAGEKGKDKMESFNQQIQAQAAEAGMSVDDYNADINKSWSEKAWDGTKSVVSKVGNGIKYGVNYMVEGTKANIGKTVGAVSDAGKAVGDWIVATGNQLDALDKSLTEWFDNKIDWVTKTLPETFFKWWHNEVTWVTKVLPENISNWIGNRIEWIRTAMKPVSDFFSDPIGKLSGLGQTIVNSFGNWWKGSTIKKVADFVCDKLINNPVANAGKAVVNGISNAAESVANTTKKGVSSVINFGKNLFGFGNGEKRYISSGRGTSNGMTYYSQKDPRWADKSFKAQGDSLNDTVGSAGCGPTAVSMALSKYGINLTPDQTANIAQKGGYKVSGEGTTTSFITDMLNSSGVNASAKSVGKTSVSEIDAQLATGNPVITLGADQSSSTPYTNAGHYLVIGGKDANGNYMVNDPLNPETSKKSFSPESLLSKTQAYWSNDSANSVLLDGLTGGASDSDAITAINTAKSYIGSPYVWGGTGAPLTEGIVNSFKGTDHNISQNPEWQNWLGKPGFDCSGLMQASYAAANIDIGRSTYDQVKSGSSVPQGSEKPSDLVLFGNASAPHHVGMYLGNGMFIHAPASGDVVKISELKSRKDYSTARRIVPNPPEGDFSTGDVTPGTATGTSATGSSSSSPLDVFSEMSNIFGKAVSAVAFGNEDYLKDEPVSTGGATSDSSGSVQLSGSDNAQKVWNFFTKDKGFTKEATAGILGNMQQESEVNPTLKQSGGGPGRGIVQWETGHSGNGGRGRWDQLTDWASANGLDPWSLEAQLQYLWKELNGDAEDTYNAYLLKQKIGGLQQFGKLTDYKQAVKIFEESVERAGTPMWENRYKYAEQYLNQFGNGSGRGLFAKLTGRGSVKANRQQSNLISTMKKFTGRGTDSTNVVANNNNYKIEPSISTNTKSNVSNENLSTKLLSAILNVLTEISGNTSAIASDTSVIKDKETTVNVQQSSTGRGESTVTKSSNNNKETHNIFLGRGNNDVVEPSRLDARVMKMALGDLT